MKANLLIKGGRVVHPSDKTPAQADVLIREGRVEKIAPGIDEKGIEVFKADGFYVIPGLLDLHTHFREPGYEAKETIHTGAMAAIKGGYVASVSMPNTNPPCDQQSVVDNILRKAKEVPYYIFPAGTISKGRRGKELSEMADLKNAGIVGVTDDGDWVADALLMRRAMEYASMLDLLVMSHCEDTRLSAGGVMNEGLTSTMLGLRGIASASEEIAVARDIELARYTGARLHICHISTARSVELVRRAKEEGLLVTSEVTPHNLTLTDSAIEGYNTNCKMYPPLRTQTDIDALKKGLADGVIDCIATDHAPHTQEEKMRQFDEAPFGTIGLETALPVILTELYHKEKWNLSRIVETMSTRPAEILGIQDRFGRVTAGQEANLAVVDVDGEWVVARNELRSKSSNSCFMRTQLKGKVLATVCAGKLWQFD